MDVEFFAQRSWYLIVQSHETDLFRVRLKYNRNEDDDEYTMHKQFHFPKRKCNAKNAHELHDALERLYGDIIIGSYKGPSAAMFRFTRHIKACNLVDNKKNRHAIVITGWHAHHMFLFRFTFSKEHLVLSSIYGLDAKSSKTFLSGTVPTLPYLCCVCFKSSDMCCSKCSTVYCSKSCQRLDFAKHRSICGKSVDNSISTRTNEI
jgi:hypothetical protein